MPAPLIAGLIKALATQGLGMLGNAILAKGKDVIEDKIGVKIPDNPAELTPEKSLELMKAQHEHEEFLVNAAIKEKELEIEADEAGQGQVTERWKADMLSDSWLSKNVRPMTLVYWTVAITVLVVLDSAATWLNVHELWIDLIKWSYMTILGAYFLGRGAEKGIGMVTRMKEKIGAARR